MVGDIGSSRVRDVWRKVACLIDSQALVQTIYPFAKQRHALRDDFANTPYGSDEVADLARNMSIDDAILLVKLLASSLTNHGLDSRDLSADLGLSSPAFDAIVSITYDLGRKEKTRGKGAYFIIDTAVVAAALKICAADPQEALGIAMYLFNAVSETVAQIGAFDVTANGSSSMTPPIPNGSAKQSGLFWVLEIMFHLCQPGGSASSLLNSRKSVEMLLRAAYICEHLSFTMFVFQNAIYSSSESGDDDNSLTKEWIRQLAQSDGLRRVSAMLDNEVSDAIYLATAGSAESVDEATKALYGLSFADLPTGSVKSLAEYEAFDNSVSKDKTSLCLVASDYLLGHGLARTMQRMVLPDTGAIPFKDKALRLLHSNDAAKSDQKLKAVSCLFRLGYASSAASFSLLTKQEFVCSIRDESKAQWSELFTASRISAGYLQGATTLPLVTVSQDSPLKLLCFVPRYETGGGNGLLDFSADIKHLHAQPLPNGVTIDVEELPTNAVPDTAKAKEALLYYGLTYGGLSNNICSALFTDVLLNHVERIRFTQAGVFDPVARLFSLMATQPADGPQITAPEFNTNAVNKLAYYIPQLFAMLRAKDDSSSEDGDSRVCLCAFSILELIAANRPDLVAFYTVVAKNSLPDGSLGSKYANKLIKRFDSKQAADIEAFVSMMSSVAVLPQEKLRWVSIKSKSAYLKVIARYQQGRFGTPARKDEVSAAILKSLQPAIQILDDYSEKKPPVSPVEHDFCACLPRLRLLFDQLCFSDGFGQDDPQLKRSLDQIWNEIFKTLGTATTLPIGYINARLARFTASISIPVLTSPTEPVYFSHISSTIGVIGSKTRPKLITLYLTTSSGAVCKEKYILKGSEDLRIDESVMQTFVRVNRVAAAKSSVDDEKGPSDAVLSLPVYNVVPLGTYGGLIQVIDNAPSLFQIYSQHAMRNSTVDDAGTNGIRTKGSASEGGGSNSETGGRNTGTHGDQPSAEGKMEEKQRQAKNQPPPPSGGLQQTYMDLAQDVLKEAGINPGLPFEKWPASVATAVYDRVSRTVPPDLLYRHLLRSAQSSSHLYLLTKSMVRSISMSSMVGYLLGVGDRHLDNLLVDARRGHLVQIDFNVCYDFGSVSHVPERVPFRMTPILTYICGSPRNREDGSSSASLPLAYSRVFTDAASSVLVFCRMDRDALVNALASRVLFQPFKEWSVVEEAHLVDAERKNVAIHTDIVQPPSPSSEVLDGENQMEAAKTLWRQENTVSVSEFIRRTGICPSNAFWRFGSGSGSGSGNRTECKYGWRIAQAAVSRVDARLDYQGINGGEGSKDHPHVSVDMLVEEQVAAIWSAATCKERLARMYIGWAPWI
ncbi:Serine/threonine-protein kinase smg1 [Coemansia sp. RSA 1939]|nr:Serine/threonine-protein kinase smg1 [Coemansia sp. RSA 1939]